MEAPYPSSSDLSVKGDGEGKGGQSDRVEGPDGRDMARPSRPSAGEIDAVVEALRGNDPESRRFSMWGLLGIVTAASVVLSLGSYLPKSVFAGTVGMATLVTMVALSAMKNPPAVFQAAWWVLLLIYMMSIVSAVWG